MLVMLSINFKFNSPDFGGRHVGRMNLHNQQTWEDPSEKDYLSNWIKQVGVNIKSLSNHHLDILVLNLPTNHFVAKYFLPFHFRWDSQTAQVVAGSCRPK